MIRRQLLVVVTVITIGCGGSSPTGPSNPPPSSGGITLSGDLNFGDVPVATLAMRTFVVSNTSDSSRSVTATVPPGYVSTLTTDSFFPGETQTFHVIFTPSEARVYSGSLSVGGRTLPVSGTGTLGAGLSIKTFSGNSSGGDPPCRYGLPPFTFDIGVCQTFDLAVGASGPVHGLLNYNGDDALLELEFYNPTTGREIAGGDLTFDPYPGNGEHSAFSTNIGRGNYHLRVRAISSTRIAPFQVIVTHP